MMRFLQCLLLLLCVSFKTHPCTGIDHISPTHPLSQNQTLTSLGGNFELGFFKPGASHNYYLGIWYKKVPGQTVVWVANREQPVSDPFLSTLKLSEDANLLLLFNDSIPVWSTDTFSDVSSSTRAILLDNGNFVIRDASNFVLWQSFDYPTHTWLPGGKIGYNKRANKDQMLTSWRSLQNPAPSLFSIGMERNGTSHVLRWNQSQTYWTTGEWTGSSFRNVPEWENVSHVNITHVSNENESYFTYASTVPSAFMRHMIDVSGQLRQFVWQRGFGDWKLSWTIPPQQCEVYAFCGAFGICIEQEKSYCACMKGFEPKNKAAWELDDHTDGCVRKAPLKCDNGGKDTFHLMDNLQFEFPSGSEYSAAKTIEECESACLNDCSCNAFQYDVICLIWRGDLLNVRKRKLFPNQNINGDVHIRIAKPRKKITWIIVSAVAGFCSLCSFLLLILWSRRRQSAGAYEAMEDSMVVFRLKELRHATKNFSEKLGEGGFGSVFKGTLPNSNVIAVKQLGSLQQGQKQFITEVKTIGTIQHINLVRLRGFCAEASKRYLVYDYMPNGSLETLLFQKSGKVLDWESRYRVAIGSARGLAYLHEGCRECIMHFDIKPENILLDAECNPKVADFGLAKILGRDFSRVLTTMRGTIGYLAPEWISGEPVTPKADVFSYGMLLCELISGRRNREFFDNRAESYFPFRLASTIKREEDVLTLLDPRLEGNASKEEVIRACKVACWCIQDYVKDRPSMRQVVQILEGVSEIGKPSMPLFLQHLAENAEEVMVFQDIPSG